MLVKLSQFKKQNFQLQEESKVREVREYKLLEVISTFTNSSKMMDQMVSEQRSIGDKTGLGFDHSSASHLKLTKPR